MYSNKFIRIKIQIVWNASVLNLYVMCSSESSCKDGKQVETVPKNELKSAAAYFSLMSINSDQISQ